MDPNATLNAWYIAINNGRRSEANEHYENLRTWLERGGFEPEWHPYERRDFFSYNPRTGKCATYQG